MQQWNGAVAHQNEVPIRLAFHTKSAGSLLCLVQYQCQCQDGFDGSLFAGVIALKTSLLFTQHAENAQLIGHVRHTQEHGHPF